jgi:uncharacterized DUF497 family protein
MRIAWDSTKAAVNEEKHGVSFEEAATVLSDPLAQSFEDDSGSECRFITLGHSAFQRALLVVWSEMASGMIRIISARKPTKRELSTYEKGI